jgi:hypothetical protein
LRELPDSAFAELHRKLENSPDSIPSIESLSPANTQQVMDTLRWMYQTRIAAEVEVTEFIDDACGALRGYEQLTPSSEPRFRERLLKLLNIAALSTEAKAFTLYGEHANVFCSTRILTDMRPVFGTNVSDPPEGYLVTHTLKFDYHASQGRMEEFYLALASEDLVELRIALDRAEVKAKSLRQALEKTNLKFIDPQHPER